MWANSRIALQVNMMMGEGRVESGLAQTLIKKWCLLRGRLKWVTLS